MFELQCSKKCCAVITNVVKMADIIGMFILDHKYEIEYGHYFLNFNRWHFQSPHFLMLVWDGVSL